MDKTNKTSWGKVADWYDNYLNQDDTYQSKIILPNLMRLIDLQKNQSLLELGCGQGYFLEKFAQFSNNLCGVEIGKELLEKAKQKNPNIDYVCVSADDSKILPNKKFDFVTIILALQNMKNLDGVISNVARLLNEKGRAYLILNHPTFRIPQNSDWGFDESKQIQYRKIEKYQSEIEIKIDMNPGKKKKEITRTFHRPLQVYSKAFSKHNLAITKIEEWISHKQSQAGPRAKAEDLARKEIPMFMCLELKKI